MEGVRAYECLWAEEFAEQVGDILRRHMEHQEGRSKFDSDVFREGAEAEIDMLCAKSSIYVRGWEMPQLKMRQFRFEAGVAESNGKRMMEFHLRKITIKVTGNWEGEAEIEEKITY